MIARLLDGVPGRGLAVLAGLLAVLLAAPWVANDYVLTVLIIVLYSAYTGQAWNVMMGFAGQLSLGHAIYVGLGGYAAAALYVHFGVAPWLGLAAAVAIAAACVRRVRAHRLRSFPLGWRVERFLSAGCQLHAQ
jgi:branched-chain amino acid transport system permease protein